MSSKQDLLQACPFYAPFFGFAGMTMAMSLSGRCLHPLHCSNRSSLWHSQIWKRDSRNCCFSPPVSHDLIVTSYYVGNIRHIRTGSGHFYFCQLRRKQTISAFHVRRKPDYRGMVQFGVGLTCGLSSLAGGFAIGVAGDACIRAYCRQPKFLTGLLLIMIFAEMISLFGMIIAMMLNTVVKGVACPAS
jgi:V-type H+-transporting ATPase 16kDa proteolipid subunit